MRMQSPAHRIIFKFGGIRALSAALGHKTEATVRGWHARAMIPPRYHPALFTLARITKVKLSPADFIAPPPKAEEGRA